MNGAIVRLFLVVVGLFALLVAFTSRWTVFEADALRDNPDNKRAILQEQKIRRGVIRARDGALLARSVNGPGDTYERVYPERDEFAHATGFASFVRGRTGLEREYNDQLTGRDDEISTVLRQISGKKPEGDDVVTTIDARAQAVAERGLAGRKGAVVAIEPATGAVRVMVSLPSFDPNRIDRDAARLNRDPDSPLLNRATQAGYVPGSTMKVVTAAAALDSGDFTPDTTIDGRNGKVISGRPLNNFGGESFGRITLTDALTHSVNTVWAEVGEKLGKGTMGDYMERFGFYDQQPLDYPSDQIRASGEFRGGRLLSPNSKFIDVGRMAIGQDKLNVTPLQMAVVAATVANGGVRMKPRLVDRVVDRDGRVVDAIEPEEAGRVISDGTARALTGMMKNVVREGTGTAAALEGVEVAGKTGTAELDIARRINQPWFIGFTSGMAVAVTLERVPGGQGGIDAAPIAKQVLEALGQ